MAKESAGQYCLDDPRVSSEDIMEMSHAGSGQYWHRKPVEDEANFNPYAEEDDE